ncbi:hypothetical protein B0H10DRAFT_1957691 [Mycena sp. CBHHK59/15]|nr:hypothetical protein B0H10DRAFT_1957691 [Mycena sp. CBHHK59/15]
MWSNNRYNTSCLQSHRGASKRTFTCIPPLRLFLATSSCRWSTNSRYTPIFGPTPANSLSFPCPCCGRGNGERTSLRTRRNLEGRCPVPNPEGDANLLPLLGYGRAFTHGRHPGVFRVDPKKLPLRSQDDPSPSDVFVSTFPPPFDYSKMPMVVSDRELDLSNFAWSEGWMEYAAKAGLIGEEIQEVIQGSWPR